MRTTNKHGWVLVLAAAFCLAGTAVAQPPAISSELQVQRVETVAGQSVLKPASTSKPGDVLEYQVTYTNHAASAISGLVANLPIPVGTTLIDRSALPGEVLASTDGSTFAPPPLMRVVKSADGSKHQVEVPLEEYRALRWNLGTLPAGGAKQVQARVRVNTVQSASAVPPAPRG
jgi:uncharacterized repeat protein (TIGR01451 family)